ncbi:MAG: hypothetical protein AB8H79_12815 [Myxococcota bacterium]
MIDLPLRDEIREARKVAERAEKATWLLHRADAVLQEIAGRLQHPHAGTDTPPGEDIVEEAADGFVELRTLPDLSPSPGTDRLEALRARKTQLTMVQQTLASVAAQHNALSRAVHTLQRQQSEALKADKYEEVRAALAKHSDDRMTHHRRITTLQPIRQALLPFQMGFPRIADEIEEHLQTPESVVSLACANAKIAAMVQTLEAVVVQAGLDPEILESAVFACEPPNAPNLTAALQALRTRSEAVVARANELDEQIDEATAAYQRATDWLLQHTG